MLEFVKNLLIGKKTVDSTSDSQSKDEYIKPTLAQRKVATGISAATASISATTASVAVS